MEWKSVGKEDISQDMQWKNKVMFQTTNQMGYGRYKHSWWGL